MTEAVPEILLPLPSILDLDIHNSLWHISTSSVRLPSWRGTRVVPIIAGSTLRQDWFECEPINYLTAPLHDPVALLQAKLQAGKVALGHDDRQGSPRSVLEQLNVPISSQVLVFSKTGFWSP